jgi:hypothetical protein
LVLPDRDGDVWYGFVAGVRAGQVLAAHRKDVAAGSHPRPSHIRGDRAVPATPDGVAPFMPIPVVWLFAGPPITGVTCSQLLGNLEALPGVGAHRHIKTSKLDR